MRLLCSSLVHDQYSSLIFYLFQSHSKFQFLGVLRNLVALGQHRRHDRLLLRHQPCGRLPDAALPGLGHVGLCSDISRVAGQQGERRVVVVPSDLSPAVGCQHLFCRNCSLFSVLSFTQRINENKSS